MNSNAYENTDPYAVFRNSYGQPRVYIPESASNIRVYPVPVAGEDQHQYKGFTGIFVADDVVIFAVNGKLHSTVGPAWYNIDSKTQWFYTNGVLIAESDFKRDYLMTHMREWDKEEWMKMWEHA